MKGTKLRFNTRVQLILGGEGLAKPKGGKKNIYIYIYNLQLILKLLSNFPLYLSGKKGEKKLFIGGECNWLTF